MDDLVLNIFTNSRKSKLSQKSFQDAPVRDSQKRVQQNKKYAPQSSLSIAKNLQGPKPSQAFTGLMKGIFDMSRRIQEKYGSRNNSSQNIPTTKGSNKSAWRMDKVNQQNNEDDLNQNKVDKAVGTLVKNFLDYDPGPMPIRIISPEGSRIMAGPDNSRIIFPPQMVNTRPISTPKPVQRYVIREQPVFYQANPQMVPPSNSRLIIRQLSPPPQVLYHRPVSVSSPPRQQKIVSYVLPPGQAPFTTIAGNHQPYCQRPASPYPVPQQRPINSYPVAMPQIPNDKIRQHPQFPQLPPQNFQPCQNPLSFPLQYLSQTYQQAPQQYQQNQRFPVPTPSPAPVVRNYDKITIDDENTSQSFNPKVEGKPNKQQKVGSSLPPKDDKMSHDQYEKILKQQYQMYSKNNENLVNQIKKISENQKNQQVTSQMFKNVMNQTCVRNVVNEKNVTYVNKINQQNIVNKQNIQNVRNQANMKNLINQQKVQNMLAMQYAQNQRNSPPPPYNQMINGVVNYGMRLPLQQIPQGSEKSSAKLLSRPPSIKQIPVQGSFKKLQAPKKTKEEIEQDIKNQKLKSEQFKDNINAQIDDLNSFEQKLNMNNHLSELNDIKNQNTRDGMVILKKMDDVLQKYDKKPVQFPDSQPKKQTDDQPLLNSVVNKVNMLSSNLFNDPPQQHIYQSKYIPEIQEDGRSKSGNKHFLSLTKNMVFDFFDSLKK